MLTVAGAGVSSRPAALPSGRFARNVVALLVGRVGTYVLTIVTGVVLARALGPEGRGAYQAVVLWPQILCWIATLGFTKATGYYRALDGQLERKLVANALVLCVTTGVALVGVMTFLLPRLLHGYSDEIVALATVMLWCVPFMAFENVLEGLFEGSQAFRTLAAIRLVMPLFSVVALASLWKLDLVTVASATAVYAAGMGLVLLVPVAILWQRGSMDVRPDRRLFSVTGRYALQYYPYTLCDIALGLLDQILLIPVLPAAAVGVYVIATRAMLVSELPGAMSQVLFASIPKLERRDSLRVIKRAISGGAVISAACAAVLFVLARPVLEFLYGEAFLSAVVPFRILLVGAFAMGLRKLVGEALAGLGRPRANSVIQVGATVLFVGLLLYAVPRFGIVGAAWSVAIVHMVNLTAGLTWLMMKTGSLKESRA